MTDPTCWSVWAKSGRDDQNRIAAWLPLHQHLDDTAGVAGLLVDHWISPHVIALVAQDFPGGTSEMRALATWLAGTHDVGKISPAFSVQVPELTVSMGHCGLTMSPILQNDPDRGRVSHALVGQLAIRDWLVRDLGFSRRGIAAALASIIGSHHGVPPEQEHLSTARGRPDLMGVGDWARTREAMLRRATDRIGGTDVLRGYQQLTLNLPSQVLLTASVILADWIASNPDLFPL
jgi:CRISPR-associated endonuclease/helicase Cas3